MSHEQLQDDRERRKLVRLRRRPDLEFTPQVHEGAMHYVVKDPASLAYYRFDESDHFLLEKMDGSHTMEEIREEFERRFRPRRLSLEDLEAFAQNLLNSGLAIHDLPQAGRQLYDRYRKRWWKEWLRVFTNILYIEIPLFDPDPILGVLLRYFGWIFTRAFLVFSVCFMLSALLLVGTHFREFYARLPSAQEFFGFKTAVSLWVAIGLVKILHEFGHGLACKAQGGESHDMGVLFMCLSPCLYFNVSDAWMLPDKWRRIIVGLAGIYIELMIAAAATFVWWNTQHATTANRLALSLMVVCSANTLLFNGNPLLRFDGYYVLADWLEVPNLRERANNYLKYLAMVHCLGIEMPPEPPMAFARRVLFVIFAVASYIYGWVVTFSVLWFLSRFLAPYKLGSVSMMLAMFSVASMIGWPLYYLGRNLHRRGKLPTMQPRRVGISAGIAFSLLLTFFFLPLPVSRVRQPALIQIRPDAVEKVYAPATATLEIVHVRDGETVQAGDLLAEFRSREMEGELEEARGQYAGRVVQLKALRQQAAETIDPLERSKIETNIAQADGERLLYARQIDVVEKRIRALSVTAPRAGVVLGAPRPEDLGKLWEKDQGVPICSVGNPRRLRAVMPLSSADYRLLREDVDSGQPPAATVRVHGGEWRTWHGQLAPLPESEALDVPIALTVRGGGSLAMKQGTRPNTFVPQTQQYLVGIDLVGAEEEGIWPGTRAQVKVHCRYRSAAWWAWRAISSAFDVGLI